MKAKSTNLGHMDIESPSNATLADIADVILNSDRICICGHVNPDGDCIGSTLGLNAALTSVGKEVYPLLVNADPIHPAFDILPGADKLIPAADFRGEVDLFICVDVSGDDRIGSAAFSIKASAKKTMTIDHHEIDHTSSDFNLISPSAPSTTMLIWDLIHEMDIELTSEIATCCFFGLMTDTGGFRHSNSTEDAFSYAASMVGKGADPNKLSEVFFQRRSLPSVKLEEVTVSNMELFCGGSAVISYILQSDMDELQATKADTEPLIDILRSIDGVKVCCILKCLEGQIRGSLRSKDGIDVNLIAKELGGGGHKAASGFTMHCSLDEALSSVKSLIEASLS